MKLSEALEGFLLIRGGEYARSTVRLYKICLEHLVEKVGDKEIADLTQLDLAKFMNYLRNDYIPPRLSGRQDRLSDPALDNYWKAMRSFCKFIEDEFVVKRVDASIKRPKYRLPEVTSFSPEEVKRILHCAEWRETERNGRKFKQRQPLGLRNKALLLLMLDTGLRVSEVTRLTMADANLETGEVIVSPFGSGQKTKPRTVVLGMAARRALWIYLARNRVGYRDDDNLFCMTDIAIRHVLYVIGKVSGIGNVHPHRFRHTFAIMFLRNGGDVFTLQRMLGHSTLDMVRHYLDIASADVARAALSASPADRLGIK